MGIFDNIGGLLTGSNAADAAAAQKAGLTAGYGQASDALGQGRAALTSNYTDALQPFLKNFQTSQAGQNAYANATGANGPTGSAQAAASFQADPGTQFRLQQGNENILRNASRTGAVNSGGTNIDLLNYGQGQANQGWQQYIQNLQPFLGGSAQAAAGIAGVDTGLGTNLNQSYGNLASLGFNTQTGIGNATANADLAKNTAGAADINLGLNAAKLGTSIFSDERLKEDIEPVGELFDGTNVYRYRYKGDDVPRIGLIAQEVEQKNPDAVKEFGGFKAVNYKAATDYAAQLSSFLDAA